ncbi:MAG: efflux RND transporter periplasmic adaptor subunit [Gammaproteobacteria bacterium]|nr:efflux RND transporter periplasmic adaptor subunit [Gammaproteobacteria bacterium]
MDAQFTLKRYRLNYLSMTIGIAPRSARAVDLKTVAETVNCYHRSPSVNAAMPSLRHLCHLTVAALGLLLLPLFAISPAADESAVRVRVAALESLQFQPHYSAPATALSLFDSRISPRIQGRIARMAVRVGDRVRLNETLAELECDSYISERKRAAAGEKRARSALTLAQRQLRRTRSLMRERNVSEELLNQREADLSSAEADLESAGAALEIASVDVGHCRIAAPFNGVVGERFATTGEWITPGSPLLRLVDTERLEVSAQIPLAQVGTLEAAEVIELLVDGESYPLRLRQLLPLIDSRGRHREARLQFQDDVALAGGSGRLRWQATRMHLPSDLLVRRGQRLGVMLEKNGKARFVAIAGALEGQPAAFSLPAGSRLVTEGRLGLNDGDSIEIQP